LRCILGLDDTDHSEVGCTTANMDELLTQLENDIQATVIERRLIRLWPFAERRTRGNGALGAIIEVKEDQINNVESICRLWFSELIDTISNYPDSVFEPSPCLVISFGPVPEEWYWEAVRGYVSPDRRLEQAFSNDCIVLLSDTNFGVVGACAAVSWIPESSASWELIAWREDSKIGSPRMVSKSAVYDLERSHNETFLNRDPTKDKGMIAPRTPCPVLYGIRGSSISAVHNAHCWLQARDDVEKCHSFAVHLTNQLSDDHIESYLSGTVTSEVTVTQGGHAYLSVFSGNTSERLVAFSEGGPVNDLLRKLAPGDRISWVGLKSPDGAIHLERIRIDDASPRITGRPVCCSKTMRSAGRNQELRCLSCGRTEQKSWHCIDLVITNVDSRSGWIEPTPSNRRHLSKPLSLGTPGSI